MHKNISITDGVYGILFELDVKQYISILGKNAAVSPNENDLVLMLRRLLEELENGAR